MAEKITAPIYIHLNELNELANSCHTTEELGEKVLDLIKSKIQEEIDHLQKIKETYKG